MYKILTINDLVGWKLNIEAGAKAAKYFIQTEKLYPDID